MTTDTPKKPEKPDAPKKRGKPSDGGVPSKGATSGAPDMDTLPPAVADPLWYDKIQRSARWPTIIGFAIIFVALFGFGSWATNAPIAGAAVSPGNFVATGQNKIIQHLQGGIIDEILVSEGQTVDKGQTLVRLNETDAKARLRRLVLRHSRLRIIEARLRSEATSKGEVKFSLDLLEEAEDPDIQKFLESEIFIFSARYNKVHSEMRVLEQGISALEEQISGTKAQLAAIREQLTFIDEELGAKSSLLKQGIIKKPEVLALQRAQAKLRGDIGQLIGNIGSTNERIARTREQINAVQQQAVQEAVESLRNTEADLQDVREQIRSAKDTLSRINIVAPVSGVVVRLRYHTSGGVIEPGKNILELLPIGEDLVIESRVRPQDIDSVEIGQKALVRLTALNQRVTPMVTGKVVYLSADTIPDDRNNTVTRSDIYIARIELDRDVAMTVEDFRPIPGMPVEVFIQTSERTFFEYLMRPLYDSMSRAFRES